MRQGPTPGIASAWTFLRNERRARRTWGAIFSGPDGPTKLEAVQCAAHTWPARDRARFAISAAREAVEAAIERLVGGRPRVPGVGQRGRKVALGIAMRQAIEVAAQR